MPDHASGSDSTAPGDGDRPDSTDSEDRSPVANNGMLVTERETEKGLLVAVADGDILGETFEEGQFSLTVNEEFYGGDEVDEAAVVDSLARATVANIVGTRAVELAVEEGIIDEANVLDIGATRHAQLLRMY